MASLELTEESDHPMAQFYAHVIAGLIQRAALLCEQATWDGARGG